MIVHTRRPLTLAVRDRTSDTRRIGSALRAWLRHYIWDGSPVSALILVSLCAMLASCGDGVLDPHGPIGQSEKTILFDATVIMLAVGVPVMVLALVFAWWFRAGNRHAQYRPDWEYSGRIELIIWSIPALVILFLGGIAWIGSHDLDPPRPLASREAPVEVEVIALDWRWLFIYPELGVASLNGLTVPTGVPVHFRLTSASVMNSFFVPQLGSQIYAMAGMTTQLNLRADDAGTYQGLSAQFSGPGFADMHFELVATSPTDFQRWLERTRAGGGVLDSASYALLSRPTRAGEAMSFAQVDPQLFTEVAGGKIVTHWTEEEAR
jgi:cytochrome o ubiquinol oxidase subunit 2